MSSIELEKSLLAIQNIFELLVNTLTPDGKPSLLNRDNLTQPIQLQISKKQRSFSHFLSVFSKSSSNFEHFQKKMTLEAYVLIRLKSIIKHTNNFHITPKSIIKHTSNFHLDIMPRSIKNKQLFV